MIYLLDTDTVNYILRAIVHVKVRYEEALSAGAVFVLCPIVHFEITRYLKLRAAIRFERAYHQLIQSWDPVELYGSDWDTAADLWAARHRAGRPIEDSDLLVAVTALKTGAILVTNNTGHFVNLGLTLQNWALP